MSVEADRAACYDKSFLLYYKYILHLHQYKNKKDVRN